LAGAASLRRVITTSNQIIAEELERFGETETAAWVRTCDDDELVRVCSVADWLALRSPTRSTGARRGFSRSLALAAVYVHEASPRHLRRKRPLPAQARRKGARVMRGRWPSQRAQTAAPVGYGVGDDARRFWGS
jgi:hypothetical protein